MDDCVGNHRKRAQGAREDEMDAKSWAARVRWKKNRGQQRRACVGSAAGEVEILRGGGELETFTARFTTSECGRLSVESDSSSIHIFPSA